MTTQVKFDFKWPDGRPLAVADIEIRHPKAGFVDTETGIVIPETFTVTTDAEGFVLVGMEPSSRPYYVQLPDPESDECCGLLKYKFYVPDVTDQVRLQDLILDPPPSTTAYDEAAILQIMQYKVEAKASADSALNSANRAETALGQMTDAAERAEASATAAKASENASKTSQTAAAASQAAAAQSATNSQNSAVNAGNYQTNAANSANAALASQNAAKTSETNSKTSETNAKTSETNAKTSETNSKASETSASTSAGTASTQATNAATARTAAEAARDLAQKWASNPENTIVTGSSYSALHYAAKAAASAAQAAAVVGPRLNSISQLVMAVNDMLIADSATTMTKIATGATGRSMLTAVDAAAGRNVLGLKAAALSDVTTSNVDSTTGRLLKVGDFGLGAVNAPQATAANDINYSGFYYAASTATNLPVAANGILHHYAFSDGSAAFQLYSSLAAPTRTFMRSKSSGTWNAWKELWTSENLVKTASVQDSTLGNMLKVGDFGFGKDSVTITDPDTVYRGSGFYDVASGATWAARPIPGWTRIFHQSHGNSAGYATQIATADFTSTTPRLFYRNCQNGTWTGWFELWSSNSFRLSSSNVDPDMSKVSRTGDFGIGNTNAAPLANDANAVAASGMYATNGSGTITNYPVAANGMLIHSEWNGDAGASQIFITTATNQMWFRNQTAGNWQPWKELWSSNNLVKTASPTDTTAGRMVQVGDFGANGGDVIGLAANISWDTVTTPGEYVIFSATGANTPPGGGSFFITVRKYSNNFKQVAFSFAGSFAFSRVWNGSTWSAWDVSFSRSNLLGTVSQASGVPTGAVIERGSNANGEYTKYADGTLICTGKSSGTVTTTSAGGNLYYNTIAAMTFASTFVSAPSLQISTDRTTNFFTWAAQQSTPTATSTGLLAVCSPSNNAVGGISYVAVGRWF